MKVLVCCEYTQTVTQAFLAAGHDAWSNDILDTEGDPKRHLKMDAMLALSSDSWDLAILHPPCTHMAVCGNATWAGSKEREDAIRWTLLLWTEAKRYAKRVALENPVSAIFPELRKFGATGATVQYIQPWMFGHPEQKRTGLAIHNLPKLTETNNVYAEMMKLPRKQRERIHFMSPSATRGLERSRTFPGIADAFVQQWGSLED